MSRALNANIRSVSGVLVAACAVLALAVIAALTARPAQSKASGPAGTCLASESLPCTATARQTYSGVTLGADTPGAKDSEAAVEAVLAEVIGPPVDVESLGTGLSGDSGEFDFTPNKITDGHSFKWSYAGGTPPAYLSVKAGDAFALIGIAGLSAGSVDVAALLGGHEISHVGFWSATISKSEPVPAERLHGQGFLGNARLGEIEGGKVPCVHVDTNESARCAFSRRGTKSGSWLESPNGDFALVGQPISLQGQPGGEYVIAAKVSRNALVPALEPSGHDSVGTSAGMELGYGAIRQTLGSPSNAAGRPLVNHATREVCTSSHPHPETATDPEGVTTPTLTRSPEPGVYCYIGKGAGLNDRYGTERDQYGQYLAGSVHQHVAWNGSYEVPVAKRPQTTSWPVAVMPKTPLLWRAVASGVAIAN